MIESFPLSALLQWDRASLSTHTLCIQRALQQGGRKHTPQPQMEMPGCMSSAENTESPEKVQESKQTVSHFWLHLNTKTCQRGVYIILFLRVTLWISSRDGNRAREEILTTMKSTDLSASCVNGDVQWDYFSSDVLFVSLLSKLLISTVFGYITLLE